MVIDEVKFNDEKQHGVGDDNSTSASITKYNGEKRKVKLSTNGKEDLQKNTEYYKTVLEGEEENEEEDNMT